MQTQKCQEIVKNGHHLTLPGFYLNLNGSDRTTCTFNSQCSWFRVGGIGKSDKPQTGKFTIQRLQSRRPNQSQRILPQEYHEGEFLPSGDEV